MAQDDYQPINRAAYSPAEFAATFGRHPTWSYRLLYNGKIHGITQLGRILIPASELQRILSLAQRYNPKPKQLLYPPHSAQTEQSGETASLISLSQRFHFHFVARPNVGRLYSRSYDAVIRVYDDAGNVIDDIDGSSTPFNLLELNRTALSDKRSGRREYRTCNSFSKVK